MRQWSSRNILIAAGICGLVGLGFGAYYFLSSTNKPSVATISYDDQHWFDHKYQQVIRSVQSHFHNKKLNNDAIKSIIYGQYMLSQQSFRKFINNQRINRRKIINNAQQYAEYINKSSKQYEKLIKKQLNAILVRFHIQQIEWINMIVQLTYQSEQNGTYWSDIIQNAQNSLLDSLRTTNAYYPFKKLETILQYKLQLLKELNPKLIALHKAQDSVSKFALINQYLNDKVYIKFGIEEQYINYSFKYLKESQKQDIDNYLDMILEQQEEFIYVDIDQKVGDGNLDNDIHKTDQN